MPVYIYGLTDPRTSEIRYIGRTKDLKGRWHDHCRSARSPRDHNTHRGKWIASLDCDGVKPGVVVLEVTTEELWVAAEQWWIAYLRHQGYRLTNGSDGGEGNIGWKPTTEQIASMREKQHGRKHSKETRQKMSASRLGRKRGPMTQEQKDLYRQLFKGQILTEEHRRSISEGLRGKTFTQERRGNIARAVSKLTEDEVRDIRRRSAAGETGISLAASFGVRTSNISAIINRQTWKFIE